MKAKKKKRIIPTLLRKIVPLSTLIPKQNQNNGVFSEFNKYYTPSGLLCHMTHRLTLKSLADVQWKSTGIMEERKKGKKGRGCSLSLSSAVFPSASANPYSTPPNTVSSHCSV